MGIFQILMFNVQRQMVVDIWESDDRKLLLRCAQDHFGDKNNTFTVHEMDGERRVWNLSIETPKGCKVPRPCIDGVDFRVWNPKAKEPPDHAIDLTEEERKLLVNLLSTHTQAYDGLATRLLNKLKDLRGED